MPRTWLAMLVALGMLFGPESQAADPAPWWKGNLTFRFGADWSSGDYDGGDDTDLWFVPVSVAYELDDFRLTPYDWDLFELRISTAYLRIRGPDDFFTSGAAGDSPDRRTDHGLGDTWVRGTYAFLPKPHMRLPVVELEGKLKIPTASEDRDLGTGKLDGGVELTVSRQLGRWIPFASAGWRFLRDPADTNLRSHATASVGASFRWSPTVLAGLLYDWRDSSAEGRADSHELVPNLTWKLSPRFAVSPYAVWGIAGYVPDYAVGVTFRYALRIE